ncbi:MAG: mechanosensitive ion channel family protein [Candidatus Aenigmarchaeota archaeon]|nr:mechanosensitive ion channel family protein [Candidatus Aenigmarchaeota archaeon]
MANLVIVDLFWQNFSIIRAAIAIILSFVIAKTVNFILKNYAVKLTAKTKTNLDDMLIKSMRKPLLIGFLLYGLYYAVTTTEYLLPHAATVNEAFLFIEVFFTAFTIARIINTFLEWYAKGIAVKTESKLDDHFLSALKKVAYLLAFILGILFFMDKIGVQVTTLIAALGIGGLAIALALQDTLSNFFAGAYTTVDQPIRVNDFIELETGEKGYVKEIGWRTTKILKLDNNIVIIPNNKIAQNRIINYDMPDSSMAVGLACGVSYDSDLEKVEKISIDVAKKVMKEHAGITDFEKYAPSVRFNEFGDSNIKFNIWFNVLKATDQFRVKHEFIKELKKRFDKEGIEISYPITKVRMEKKARKRR